MTLDHFKATPTGSTIGTIITSPRAVERMLEMSRSQKPAVEAVGAEIAGAVGELDDTERKLVGRWVKELLAPRGWVPDRKGRVAAGNLFNRGTIYRARSGAASSRLANLRAAQALIATLAGKPLSADELIAERRSAFKHGE